MFSGRYLFDSKRAFSLICRRISLSSIIEQIASASFLTSFEGTRIPVSLSLTIEAGPYLQLNETIGSPHDIASIKTRPNDS